MDYLNVYEINGKRILGGIFHSKDEQDRYAEMAVIDGDVQLVAKIQIDIDQNPIEVKYL